MNNYRLYFLFILFIASPPALSIAKIVDYGSVGETYPIIETDALSEIENRVKQFGDGPLVSPEFAKQRIKNFKPSLSPLPSARRNKTFYTRLNHKLEFDVTDSKGNVVYPKGFEYNPLSYIFNPLTYVFIDGSDPKQVEWFKSSKQNNMHTKLLLTDGNYYDVMHELRRPVFYALPVIIEKFQLQAVPSVVKQDGERLKINEYKIK